MQLPIIDLGVLVLYLALVVAVGCQFVRRSGNTSEFMAAGRALPGWAVGLSIFGTYVSSISFLANPGKSFADNWNPFVFSLSLPLAAWIAVKVFVPFYRRGDEISAYHHLELRFGPWARTYAVVCYLLTQLARMATILYLVALALAPLTGWSVMTIIIVMGLLVTIYTLLGGIEAVIWTDVAQSLILSVGMLLCVGILLFRMPEGPGQLFSIAWQHDKFSLGSFGSSLTQSTFWIVLLYGLFINLQNFGIDQSYVQRYLTARTDQDASRSVWLGALLYLPVSALLFLIGTGLFSYYTAQPELLPSTGSPLKPDAVFPHFIVTELPVGIRGILIAAVMAAAMSSVDSSLNCSATLTLKDLYDRYLRPQCGERESMIVLYSATVFWGIAGTCSALAMTRIQQALDAWWQLAGVFSGGMLGLFLLGLVSRAGNRAALAAVACGVSLILWLSLSPSSYWPAGWWSNPLHGFLTIVLGTATILIVGLLLTMLLPSRSAKRAR